MSFTPEQRALLEGDEKRFQRGEACFGFGDATTAPDWVKARLIEVRSAIVAKRPVPAPSPTFIRAAETRSAALTFGRSLLRSNPTDDWYKRHGFKNEPSLAFKMRYVEKHFPRMTADEIRAQRLKRMGETIQNDAAALQAAEQLEADVRDMRRTCFPWEQ